MRIPVLTLAASLALAGPALSARAAPIVAAPAHSEASAVVKVAGGCGRAWHRDGWGRCIPNRYAYYRPYPYWAPYWPGYYYAGGHEPWNRPTPRDRIANRLNRQELRGIRYGY